MEHNIPSTNRINKNGITCHVQNVYTYLLTIRMNTHCEMEQGSAHGPCPAPHPVSSACPCGKTLAKE